MIARKFGDPIDPKKLKKGIAWSESRGGKYMINPTSSATGLYGQLYSQVDDLPMMQRVSRDSLARDLRLQDMLMDLRINEGIGGPSLSRNAADLEREYKPQLMDKWNFRPDEVAALSHFLGRQGAREYFASLRDGTEFKVPGVNKTPEEYLRIYNKGIER
jgi:hypothetical protein